VAALEAQVTGRPIGRRPRRSPGTAGAVIASAAVLTLAAILCSVTFRVHVGWPPTVAPRLAVANFSGETPRGFTSLARRVEALQAPLRWFAAIFVLLALAATGLGIFALATAMSEMVALRRRDIAIRLAIGAEARHIVAWILGKALTITGVGVVVGLSGARWLGDVLSRHLSASVASDLLVLALLCLAFGAVGVVASWRPARRASRVQPAAVFADPTV
jgi:predicted lysophospholipase L1 biosynthesis ABC-type transport system permease subunit